MCSQTGGLNRPSEGNGGGSRASKSARDGAGELGLVDGSERNALLMNQPFFVVLSLRDFWDVPASWPLRLGALEGLGGGRGGSCEMDAAVRDRYHSAVDDEDVG